MGPPLWEQRREGCVSCRHVSVSESALPLAGRYRGPSKPCFVTGPYSHISRSRRLRRGVSPFAWTWPLRGLRGRGQEVRLGLTPDPGMRRARCRVPDRDGLGLSFAPLAWVVTLARSIKEHGGRELSLHHLRRLRGTVPPYDVRVVVRGLGLEAATTSAIIPLIPGCIRKGRDGAARGQGDTVR